MQIGLNALMYMCELTFGVAMTVGSVKGCTGINNKNAWIIKRGDKDEYFNK